MEPPVAAEAPVALETPVPVEGWPAQSGDTAVWERNLGCRRCIWAEGEGSAELTDEPSVVAANLADLKRLKTLLEARGWHSKTGGVVRLPGDTGRKAVALTPEGTYAYRSGKVPPELADFHWMPGVSPLQPLPPPGRRSPPARFTFAELFAGIGGFRVGLEALGGECIFASEIDVAARRLYSRNFGGPIHGDITIVPSGQLPPHDLLVGGFPCQSFSTAGEQKGLDDPRGALFWQCVRLLRRCKPRAFLFENVAGLVTAGGGRALPAVVSALEASGYLVKAQLVDAASILPQTRKRLFLFGMRKGEGTEIPAIKLPELHRILGEVLEAEGSVADRFFLSETQWAAVSGSEYFKMHPESRITSPSTRMPAQTLQRSYHSSFRMWSQFVAGPSEDSPPRFFTPVECRRLQGFPEAFILDDNGPGGLSAREGRWYAAIGNAVPPPIVAAVAEPLVAAILGSTGDGLPAALSLAVQASARPDDLLVSRIGPEEERVSDVVSRHRLPPWTPTGAGRGG
eukprot:Hpha_TRINITY_DN29876_c0_g1::TRINITY_DN29876_c0_g1_i1::g.3015::m.3015/K00558/DNMT1, dcm; DNA (cytosine-5)-methyltransferase 1